MYSTNQYGVQLSIVVTALLSKHSQDTGFCEVKPGKKPQNTMSISCRCRFLPYCSALLYARANLNSFFNHRSPYFFRFRPKIHTPARVQQVTTSPLKPALSRNIPAQGKPGAAQAIMLGGIETNPMRCVKTLWGPVVPTYLPNFNVKTILDNSSNQYNYQGLA
jgi:hypothetical protein